MRILFVGFKGIHNTSCQLVSNLEGEKLFLTNSFAGLNRDISKVAAAYDAVYMFGLDKNLADAVRIEKCARLDQSSLFSKLDTARLETALTANGIPYTLSETPTCCLCNEAYFRMLQKCSGNAVFLHIPGTAHMTDALLTGLCESIGDMITQ